MGCGVIVVLADGFEEIEAVTPIDILRRASAQVTVAGLDSIRVKGSHDLEVVCDRLFDETCDMPFDAVVLPGGMPGASNLAGSAAVLQLCRDTYARGGIVAAICAAPAVVLSRTGLLEGRKVTGFPGSETHFPGTAVFLHDAPVVVDGRIITSRGPGTAAAFALTIVEELRGRNTAEELATRMLYHLPRRLPDATVTRS